MARRRPWPRNADDHRIATIFLARAIREIAEDLETLHEYDRITIRMAAAQLIRHAADIERRQTLAKYDEPEEDK